MTKKTKNQKQYPVIQSNNLSRYFRPDPTWNIQQQRIYHFIASLIKGTDKPETIYEFKINDMRKTLEMTESGTNYKDLMNTLKYLRDHSFWIRNEKGKLEIFSILQSVEISEDTGNVEIRFHRLAQPHLFELKDRFTIEELGILNQFSCKYTSELYWYLLSFFNRKKQSETIVMIYLSELRERMACEYRRWVDIKRYAIQKAVDEINSYTYQMRVDYEPIKIKGKVSSVQFYLSKPTEEDEFLTHQMIKDHESWKKKHKRGKPTEETRKRNEKAKELTKRTKEIESRLLNPAFEPSTESTRELLEIAKEYEALIPGNKTKKSKEGAE